MTIRSATFVTSQTSYAPTGEAEIAFVGRSNVGKSSLINMLVGSKIARTSVTPGRTRLINHFDIAYSTEAQDESGQKRAKSGNFTLLDLPGYGYAKGSKAELARWGEMIEGCLVGSQRLKHVLVLVDIRHEPSDNDKIMLKFLYAHGIPFSLIATKADKLSRAQIGKAVQVIARALMVGKDNIIVTSADKRQGREAVLALLRQKLACAS